MATSHPLRAYRNALTPKPSIYDLGRELGLSGASVSRIETGRQGISPDLAKRISSRTGIPLWQLRPDIWTPQAVQQPREGAAA